ncbi:MAG: leucyl/phenylalanyl-tRNA--protein transferase [Alphaproteobacteria bacterium]|nr:leucyl/phenylalanyl-tRNA--protein transferase [Alphaproteobacteria bacterium]
MSGLTPQLLLGAYAAGVFPMAESRADSSLHWIDPEFRGVLPLDQMHVSRRLKRTLRQAPFEVRCDTAFAQVVAECAESSEDRPDTWINAEIERLYSALFELGFAHSVECWRDGSLVGGLYGVTLGGAFFGESMFSRVTDASKVALVELVMRLRAGGFVLLDMQFVTAHLRRFGAIEVPRRRYKLMLGRALRIQAEFQRELPPGALLTFLQSVTQTS